MHPFTPVIVVSLLMFLGTSIPIAAQSPTTDLTSLFLRNASPPEFTSVPVPSGAAFCAVRPEVFDAADPSPLSPVTIAQFPLGGGRSVSLNLRRIELMAPAGVAVAGTASGDVPFELEKHLIFSGTVEGAPGSFVYLAVFRRYFAGYIDIPGPEGTSDRYLIAPGNVAGSGGATMVIYNTRLLPAARPHTECATEELPGYQQRADSILGMFAFQEESKANGGTRKLLDAKTLVAQIALECDVRYYQAHSSNLSQGANYALIVLGASSAIYMRDANVALQVPYLRIWTTTGPYSGPAKHDLLGQAIVYWSENMTSVERGATLVLSHNMGGGLANLGFLCGEYGYAVSGMSNNVNYPMESYIWDVDVVSHELGHTFGSPHTHNCSWGPPIDSCVVPEGGCTSETNPRPGSIMSYCHLNVGTNLYLHPRVATLVRRSFENAACIGPLEGVLENDIAVVSITAPALGGKIVRDSLFAPSVIVRNIGTSIRRDLSITYTIDSSTAPGTETRLYTDTRSVASISPGSSVTVVFTPVSIAARGIYEAAAVIGPEDDLRPINNTMARPFEVGDPPAARAVRVISPNGGESYPAGSEIDIRWEAAGAAAVTLQFSADDGISWSPVRYNQPGSPGTLRWKVPATPTTRGRIRINNLNDAMGADMSDAPFTITVGKDVQALGFIAPAINGVSATPLVPRVEFRNNGRERVTNVPVRLKMLWRGDGGEVYDQTATIPEIAPGGVQGVDFPATPLLPLGTHVMIARVMLEGDEDPSNDSIGRTADLDGLAPPIGVHAYPMSRSVLLRWSPSPAAAETGYRIYRGTTPENMALIASLPSSVLAYADEPLEDGTEYFYGISSSAGARVSLPSRRIPATPMSYPAGFTLPSPELILPADNASGVMIPTEFLWSTLEGGVTYQLQIAADAAMNDVLFNRFTSDPGAGIPVLFGSAYYWRVRAFNYSSIGPWSEVRRFVTGNDCAEGAIALDGVAARMKASSFTWRDTAITVEFWNYVRSADVEGSSVFSVGREDAGIRLQAHVPWLDRTLYWDYGDLSGDARISTDYNPYLDKWTHVALVSNGKDFMGIYLNGVLVESHDYVAPVGSPLSELTIGCFIDEGYHKGKIDEFRIWKKARSQPEIERDMHRRLNGPQEGLVGYWRFDEGSGRNVLDQSGNGHHGQLSDDKLWISSEAPINCDNPLPLSGPTLQSPADGAAFTALVAPTFVWSEVQGGTAYQLQLALSGDFKSTERDIRNIPRPSRMVTGLRPGTRYYWRVRAIDHLGPGAWSDVMDFSTAPTCLSPALAFNGSGMVIADSFALDGRAVTVEFWNYVDSTTVTEGSAFSVGQLDDPANRFQSHAPWSDRTLYWDYGNTRETGRLTAPYAPYLSRWTHVALVSNGLDMKTIYLNGEPVATSTTAAMPIDLARLAIGGVPGMWQHQGMIDEFRIWNTPRTKEEIRNDMYRRLARPQSGLVGYWNMDEGSGTRVHDSSGFGHDGIIQGSDSLWMSGAAIPVVPVAEPVSGPAICAAGSAQNIYDVTPRAGLRYSWNVVGGTITAGNGSPAITVRWDEREGTGVVGLRRDYDGGCADSVYMEVRVTNESGVAGGGAITDLSFTSAPEPFVSSTSIRYSLLRREHVTLAIYSLDGTLIRSLVDAPQEAGDHEVIFNGEALAAGIYICRLGAGNGYLYTRTLRLVR